MKAATYVLRANSHQSFPVTAVTKSRSAHARLTVVAWRRPSPPEWFSASAHAAASAWRATRDAILFGAAVASALGWLAAILWLGMQLVRWWLEIAYTPMHPGWPQLHDVLR